MTMAVKIKTKSGTIDIDNDVISSVVGGAATDNYGVVGTPSVMGLTKFFVVKILRAALLFGSKIMV